MENLFQSKKKTGVIVDTPRVAVLLAAHNGVQWIEQQLNSTITQQQVEVVIFVSIDTSTDGTAEVVEEFAKVNPKVVVLPCAQRFGSAARNFFRLIREVDTSDFQYIAFADQDDIWLPDKLATAIHVLSNASVAGYSSNALAFWESGKTKLLRKDYKQKKYDYMFESPGPGCTFVMKASPYAELKRFCIDNKNGLYKVHYHDWFVYAFFRTRGYDWTVDGQSKIKYRQHQTNDTGANFGLSAKIKRFKKVQNQWARDQVYLIADILGYAKILRKYFRYSLASNILYVLEHRQFRRKYLDSLVLLLIVLLGYFASPPES